VQWGARYRGKFCREKRVTMSQYYMEKSKETPAADQYKTEKTYKIPGSYKR
jgi:hypothetical protein